MFEAVLEPVFFRFKAYQHAGGLAVACDDDLLRLCLSKKARQIILDLGLGTSFIPDLRTVRANDSAPDLATIAKISTVVPETS
jgi:hypothetical protein